MLVARTATLVDDYAFAWEGDPAFDRDTPDFADKYRRWLETQDVQLYEEIVKPGEKPTVFMLRHPRARLKRLLRDNLIQQSDPARGIWSEAALLDFARFAIVEVQNLTDARGKVVEIGRRLDSEARAQCLDDESLEMLDGLGDGLLIAIGMRVFSQLVPAGN